MAFANRRNRMRLESKSGIKGLARRVGASPATKIIGAGVLGYFAFRWGKRYYDEHPEIKEFLRENLETVEDKFREYRETFTDMSH